MYSVNKTIIGEIIGFEASSEEEFASMKQMVWALITAIICWVNPYLGGIVVLGLFTVYHEKGTAVEFIKHTLLFISVPMILLAFAVILSAFA